MKGTLKLIRRFLMMVICIAPILLLLNLILLAVLTWKDRSHNGGWTAAREIGEALTPVEGGGYLLSGEGREILEQYNAWGILVEDGTGNVVWHSDNLPEEIPMHYSAAEISWYTRGYIEDYPTTVGARGEDLVILGHPKTSYWKLLWNAFDYDLIAGMPRILLTFLAVNGLLVFVIYMAVAGRVMRSVKPVIQGMETLPEEDVHVWEKGFLAEVAAAVNRVNEKLRAQERALRKRENARAGWISGVSHDIRTPLSMVMGYAAELEADDRLPAEARKKAGVIRLQSIKMKNLVGDLNLVSKLEYQMQPVRLEDLNLTAVLRQAVVDFINLDPEGKYPIDFQCPEDAAVFIQGDKILLQRAIYNVLSNSQMHNPEGCRIEVRMEVETGAVHMLLTDDGVGVTHERLQEIRNAPHYMMSSGSGTQLRHGLGLLLVHQIVQAHGGSVRIDHGPSGGFLVEVTLQVPGGLSRVSF
ncbi:HAMP domain-containing histidine kinase [Acetatifactor muris]|uniref:histidine kinase n=1 Tax=Acetatifactor muris TaxID=879566 RepID=A0A2K4ZIY2_9FIRM|nr:HAMP domain-containing sensor histidine kinase [Acetatifactor muris]MCI8799964.1 HAMP domain-containing histidine kinase [Lachnospiraceae bacterium]MCR2045946.1 HAMP domain-containing histidine kinase [Acetatifactor muris]SOY30435.1 Sensor histidine kinase TmoS [Acetatifactor muris]